MIGRAPDGSIHISLKVVPGARRDQIVGMLGQRLKVRVAAPPEDGRANQAVCRVIADAVGVKPSAVSVVVGVSSPEKIVRVEGVTEDDAKRGLGLS